MRWVWLIALVCTGCTLIGLSDDISQAGCIDNTGCEVLNVRDDLASNACQTWQCDLETAKCVFRPTDYDHDGVQQPACVNVGQPADCDDRNAEINPSASEICDGQDNDCDYSIDEGMLDVAREKALVFDADVLELDYAWNPQNEELGVAYRTAADDTVGFNVIGRNYRKDAEMLLFSNGGQPVPARNVAAAVSVGRFLLGMTEAADTQRLWVGEITGQGGYSNLRLDRDLQATGLHCAEDETCAAGPPTAPSSRLKLSPSLGKVLVAYARGEEADNCDAPEPRQMLVNLLEETSSGLLETSAAAVKLDMTDDARAPALVVIQNMALPFGWLTAYPNAAGDLILQRVDPTLTVERRLRIERGEERWTHVQLAVGGFEENRLLLGLAAQRGCGAAARVVFGVLQLSWDSTGRSELRVYRELRPIADEPGERPVLAFSPSRSNWAVAYVNDEGVFARILDRNGLAIGGAAYAIRSGRPQVADIAIAPGGDSGLFGVYTYAEPRELDVTWLRACTAR